MLSLHELVTTVAAPWVVLSPRSGQLTGTGGEGVYARDRRILSTLTVTVDGREPLPMHVSETSAASTRYDAVLAGLGDPGHDPTVTLHRTRTVTSDGFTEVITLVNRSRSAVDCTLLVALGTDLAGTAAIRSEAAAELPDVVPTQDADGLHWSDDAGAHVTARFEPAPTETAGGEPAGAGAELRASVPVDGALDAHRSQELRRRNSAQQLWVLNVEAGGEVSVVVRLSASFPATEGFVIEPPVVRPAYEEVMVECDDSRVDRWVRRSLDDVAGLQLAADGGDRYLGAGPPWYLTLFGRDSLISAGMLLPIDPDLAAGTLRALARRQGTKVDPLSAEQPGKIPHELRAEVADHGGGLVLPAAYYGTHDATQLWITTLHKAWRWGLPTDQVRELVPALEGALGWLKEYADPDGDGFLEYLDESGHGLANQGWKDSPDAVQSPDGTLANAPIALCEVQGYAYAAAVAGAELLEAFGRDGAEYWRGWAAELKERFRAAFWVDGYPAIALDGAKRPVAGPASNMGHLLGTGLLDEAEEATVAAQLATAELDSGFGLRTLSTAMTRFNPLGYHTGSVWPHDTAMTIQGLYAAGHPATGSSYARGLVKAAESFSYRLPELYGGLGDQVERTATPYPLACQPQAWAAASAIAVVVAAIGISPDVPNGKLRILPAEPFPWNRLTLKGLRLGEGELSLELQDGRVTVLAAPELSVEGA